MELYKESMLKVSENITTRIEVFMATIVYSFHWVRQSLDKQKRDQLETNSSSMLLTEQAKQVEEESLSSSATSSRICPDSSKPNEQFFRDSFGFQTMHTII